MKVIGFDPFLSAERRSRARNRSVSPLDELWARCDYITLHTPLSAETRNVIGPRELATMKPGVRIINCARGGLIDEPALVRSAHRRQGRRARRSTSSIPSRRRGPSARHAPAGARDAAPRRVDRGGADFGRRRGGPPPDRLLRTAGQIRFAVNMPTLDRAELEDLRLYLDLGRRLGMLHAQMDRGTVKAATAPLPRRGRKQEHTPDHRQLRRRLDGVRARGPGQPGQRRGPGQGAWNHARRREDDRPGRLRHDDPDRGHHRPKDVRRRRARSSASSSSDSSGSARIGSTPTSTATC